MVCEDCNPIIRYIECIGNPTITRLLDMVKDTPLGSKEQHQAARNLFDFVVEALPYYQKYKPRFVTVVQKNLRELVTDPQFFYHAIEYWGKMFGDEEILSSDCIQELEEKASPYREEYIRIKELQRQKEWNEMIEHLCAAC